MIWDSARSAIWSFSLLIDLFQSCWTYITKSTRPWFQITNPWHFDLALIITNSTFILFHDAGHFRVVVWNFSAACELIFVASWEQVKYVLLDMFHLRLRLTLRIQISSCSPSVNVFRVITVYSPGISWVPYQLKYINEEKWSGILNAEKTIKWAES